jgi:hypothetical protein
MGVSRSAMRVGALFSEPFRSFQIVPKIPCELRTRLDRVSIQPSNSGDTVMSRDRARRVKTRSGIVAALASLLVSAVGCQGGWNGGGPDDSATGGAPTQEEPPPAAGELLVTVKVQDPFGAPVPGAQIRLLRSEGTGVSSASYPADQHGRAAIVTDSLTHGVLVSAPDMESGVYESTRQADDHLDITVTLHPSSELAGGVSGVSVISNSADGRELSSSARLYVVDGTTTPLEIPFAIRIF